MKEREFFLPSSDGTHKLRCMEWIPDGDVKAVLQITHGMVEHIGRYQEFCIWMAEHGIAVIGHDHLGHGKSVASAEEVQNAINNQEVTKEEADSYKLTFGKYNGKTFFISYRHL